MRKINVLSKQTAQLIAAGEVVERPGSVFKELLENAIDSGATQIVAEIKNGGIKLIKISDNGCGIYKDDVKNAFLRHATSKLKTADDLENISSLGFRGEALASICAVSKLEIITKSCEEDVGSRFFVNAGVPGEFSEAGCANGTTIIVRDLFYNVPARMKFLKKDAIEAGICAAIIDKLILSHPEISFKFIKDGKEILKSSGNGKISSAIYSVYGKEFHSKMIPLNYDYEGVKISGFVCKPEFSKANRGMQNFFVNNRYVKVKIASVALEEAFKNSLMVGKFPCCVIYIDVSPKLVDVNVHPAKTEVKFVNEKSVFDAIYFAVKSAIMKDNEDQFLLSSTNSELFSKRLSDSSNSFSLGKNNNPEAPISKISENFSKPLGRNFMSKIFESDQNSAQSVNEQPIKDEIPPVAENKKFEINPEIKPINLKVEEKVSENFQEKIKPEKEMPEENIKYEQVKMETPCDSDSKLPKKIIGEIFDCYIIVESENQMILIDKHAAHERLIFEKLKKNVHIDASQDLMKPVVVNLEKEKYSIVINNLDLLSEAGIEAEDFGEGSIIIRSIPMYMSVNEIEDFVTEIADYIFENKKDLNPKKLDWIYHNIACRAAVKAGKSCSMDEIKNLVNELSKDAQVNHCPHGRPIYVALDKKFIEKQFGRI